VFFASFVVEKYFVVGFLAKCTVESTSQTNQYRISTMGRV